MPLLILLASIILLRGWGAHSLEFAPANAADQLDSNRQAND
jgi:hypothetical protein